jgi:hypothetical protein
MDLFLGTQYEAKANILKFHLKIAWGQAKSVRNVSHDNQPQDCLRTLEYGPPSRTHSASFGMKSKCEVQRINWSIGSLVE